MTHPREFKLYFQKQILEETHPGTKTRTNPKGIHPLELSCNTVHIQVVETAAYVNGYRFVKVFTALIYF